MMTGVPSEPYPELPSVLGELVCSLDGLLADDLVGVYLVGSLATGDFDLDSDVDFLAIIRKDLSDEQVHQLQEMHARIHGLGCYPAQHLEGSYISLEVLGRDEGVGVQPVWYLDNGSTSLERSTHDNQWHVRWVLRERGIVLAGPEPSSLLHPVPADAIRGETLATMRLVADAFQAEMGRPPTFFNTRFGQSFAVLNCCRMLMTLLTGTVQSKPAGVRWAQESLGPEWTGLVRQAWEEREGVRFCIKIHQPADGLLLQQTLEFLRFAVEEGRRIREGA